MTQMVRIKITSTNLVKLEQVCREIKDIAEKTGTRIAGPVPLPVTRLVLPTRKSLRGGDEDLA
jgi:small subunit ribosomal protein S10